MKIEYFYAENMAGILSGAKTDKIEIDFTKGKSPIVLINGGNGSGKAQPNTSIVYTPDGYKCIGDLKVGDRIINRSGNPSIVDGVYPKGLLDVYRVVFNDGNYVDCNNEHLFTVYRKTTTKVNGKNKYIKGKERVISVKELSEDPNVNNYFIPLCKPVEFNTNVSIDYDCYEFGYYIRDMENEIEDKYRYISSYDRLQIIRGIVDHNCDFQKNGELSFKTNSSIIYDYVKFLIESMGGIARSTNYKESYTIKFRFEEGIIPYSEEINDDKCNLYKPLAYGRNIKEIIYLGTKVNMTCIHIDDDDHLYLTNNFILTHNTSLLSILHPLRDCYDGRSPIFEKSKAYKEVHITNNDDYYIIKHSWSPNKAFISKNDEELNESGSIRDFAKIIKDELGIDGDYFKIGRLGSNVVNLIELKSTDRKLYMANYFPDIDRYLKLYASIRKYFTSINKQIQSLASELEKFPDKEILEEKLVEINKRLKKLTSSITKKTKEFNKLEGYIESKYTEFNKLLSDKNMTVEELMESVDENDNQIEFRLNPSIERLKKNKYFSSVLEKINTSSECLDNIMKYKIKGTEKKAELSKIQSKIDGLNNDEDRISKEIEKLNSKIKATEDMSEEIDTVEKEIKNYNSEIKKYKNAIREIESIMNEEDLNFLSFYLEGKEDMSEVTLYENNINRLFNSIIVEELLETLGELPSSYSYKEIKEMSSNSKELGQTLTSLEDKLDEVSSNITFIERNKNKLDILEDRPDKCKIDSCAFIKDSLNYKNNEYSKLDEYNDEYEKLKEEIKEIEAQIEVSEKATKFIRIFKKTVQLIKSYTLHAKDGNDDFCWSSLDKYFGIEENDINAEEILNLFRKPLPEIQDMFDVSFVKNYAFNIINFNNFNTRLDDSIKYLNSLISENDHITEYQESLDSCKEEFDTISEEMEDLNEKYDKLNTFCTSIDDLLEILNELKTKYIKLEKLTSENDSLKELLEMKEKLDKELEDNISSKNELYDEIIDLNISKDAEDNERDKIEKQLYHINILIEKKETFDSEYKNTKLVMETLDPKKGIPLELIDKQLQKFKVKTNELLSLAYGNEFFINFDLTDKDFFIKVIKNGKELPDIALASQGEVSLTSLSLSLSMLKKYNILYLDEVDGALSSKNRRIFFNVIEKQIEELGIEQVFVITHNNDFLTSDIDMILFDMEENDLFDIEDEDFLSNKVILFNIKDYRKNSKES